MCRIALLVILAAPTFSITGCATPDRFVSDEWAAALRTSCEQHGCVVLPKPIWEQIEQILNAVGISTQGRTF